MDDPAGAAEIEHDIEGGADLHAVDPRDRDKIRAVGRAVQVDLEIGEDAAGVLDRANQRCDGLAAAMLIGSCEQRGEVDLVAFGKFVVGNPVEQRYRCVRVRDCAGIEHEYVGSPTAAERIATSLSKKPVAAAAAVQKIVGAVADDQVVAVAAIGFLDHGPSADLDLPSGDGRGLAGVEIQRQVGGHGCGVDCIGTGAVAQGAALAGQRREVIGVVIGVVDAEIVAIDPERPGDDQIGPVGAAVVDDDGPVAIGRFTPVVRGRKGEVQIARSVGAAVRMIEQHAVGAIRADQFDGDIAVAGVLQGDIQLHPIDREVLVPGHRRNIGVGPRLRQQGVLRHLAGYADHLLVGRGAVQGPGLGKTGRRMRIDQSKSEIMADHVAATVPVGGAVGCPTRRSRIDLVRRQRQNFLNVAVAEVRISLQHDRHHAGHDGRGERGSAHQRVIVGSVAIAVVQRRRHDGIARRRHQNRGARRAERCDVPVRRRRSRGNHEAAVGQAVIVGVVAVGRRVGDELAIIAGGKDIDRAERIPAVLDGVGQGVLDRRPGGSPEIVAK